MEQGAPAGGNRVGDTRHTIIADSFNGKAGPIVGLRIEVGGVVVKAGSLRPPIGAGGWATGRARNPRRR